VTRGTTDEHGWTRICSFTAKEGSTESGDEEGTAEVRLARDEAVEGRRWTRMGVDTGPHWVDTGIVAPRIGLCTLNPHAGEEGDIGREKIQVNAPAPICNVPRHGGHRRPDHFDPAHLPGAAGRLSMVRAGEYSGSDYRLTSPGEPHALGDRAVVGQPAIAHRAHLFRGQRDHPYGLAGKCDELNLIAGSSFVHEYDCADIALFQPKVWQVDGDHYRVEPIDHGIYFRSIG
jgi:hypothetical protein